MTGHPNKEIEAALKYAKHSFTLIVAGFEEITPEIADALYAATRGDIELNLRDGVALLEFDRRARKLQDAVNSAIRDVETADVGISIVRVETEAVNVIAKINADLLASTSP